MVPKGWKRVSLESISDVRGGVAKGKSGLKDPIDVPYLRVANVQDGHINLEEIKTIQIEKHQLERYSLKTGDVLMNEGGDFDKLGRGDVWLGQIDPCLHQNHVFAVRPNQEVLEPYFLASLAASSYGKSYFLSCAKRSTNLASINSSQLKQFPVLVPPLPEQCKIAKILSTWDKTITTTERLLTNRQQQKKALMQRLLTGKQRFAGFEGEWKKYLQGNVATFHNGRAYKLSEWEETGTPVIRLQNLTGRGSDFYYSNLALPARQYCESGDLLYMWSATFGPHIWQGPKAIYHYHIWKIECSVDVLHKEFMFYVLNFETQRWLSKSNGMGLLHITKETMEKQTILLPSLKEQQKIASVLSATDAEITTIQNQLDNLKQQKKALMQQLLTGKRRVKVDSPALATQ